MYLSMQLVKQVVSDEDMEDPGLGMQRSKQCSLIFWISTALVRNGEKEEKGGREGGRRTHFYE